MCHKVCIYVYDIMEFNDNNSHGKMTMTNTMMNTMTNTMLNMMLNTMMYMMTNKMTNTMMNTMMNTMPNTMAKMMTNTMPNTMGTTAPPRAHTPTLTLLLFVQEIIFFLTLSSILNMKLGPYCLPLV